MKLKLIILFALILLIPFAYFIIGGVYPWDTEEEKLEKVINRVHNTRNKVREKYNYCNYDSDCAGVEDDISCDDWCGGSGPINKNHIEDYNKKISRNMKAWLLPGDNFYCPDWIRTCVSPHIFACVDGKCVLKQEGTYK